MPPKKPAPPAGNKKTQEKKKEKIIEVKITRVSMLLLAVADKLRYRTSRRQAVV